MDWATQLCTVTHVARSTPPPPRPRLAALSGYEREQVAQAVVAVRSGNRQLLRRSLHDLQQWSSARALVTLGSLCERYIHYVSAAGLVSFTGSGQDLAATLDQLRAQLPAATRPDSGTMFIAVMVATLPTSPAAAAAVEDDVSGTIVALLQLSGALAATASADSRGLIPPPATILADLRAPD